jgi:hypothetical protein
MLKHNSEECVIITATLLDKANNVVKDSSADIVFKVDGKIHIIGCDNGSIYNTVRPLDMHSITKNGKVYLVLQENGEVGNIEIEAYVQPQLDLSCDRIKLQVK